MKRGSPSPASLRSATSPRSAPLRGTRWFQVRGRGPSTCLACLLGLPMVLGCSSNRATTDAALAVVDVPSPQGEEVMATPPNLDARAGSGGGSPCDAPEQCLSGACTLGVCSDWMGAMQIAIDTTPAGAAVNESVMSFPLLVRLDAKNFVFAEARQDGSDIRFLDDSGNTLAYQIERWDAQKAMAEVWVLVPRILGNSRDNVLRMYWGNPLSASTSSGPAVFGNFSCVFHMEQAPNASATQIEDDSGHDNSGTVQSQSSAGPLGEGVAGSGLALDGSSMMSTADRLPPPLPVTFSLWLKTTSKTGGGIAGFANKPTSDDATYDRFVTMDSSGRLSFAVLHGGARSTLTSLSGYNDGQWHLIVARFSSAGQYLFVDGDDVADDPTLTSADAYPGYWRFGEEPASPGYYVSGNLDEVRVSNNELSDAWVKLSYATQRPETNAVVYSRQP